MRRSSECLQVEQQIEPLFIGTPYELFGVRVSTGGQQPIVRVFIDKRDGSGVTIDDIASTSRKISAYLDVESTQPQSQSQIKGLLNGRYILEVSSPGLDRHLLKPQHFEKQLGNKIQINLSRAVKIEGIGEQKNFKGILEKVESEALFLLIEERLHQFTFEQIDKARVIPDLKVVTKPGKSGKKEAKK